eukprot:GHVR01041909.1.p1 GENE.GHVR01041909.1~~GHVR01041909.1.p1  ORF type:complete len:126 (-),score=4.90 GHVR01041909.1:124-501(-)
MLLRFQDHRSSTYGDVPLFELARRRGEVKSSGFAARASGGFVLSRCLSPMLIIEVPPEINSLFVLFSGSLSAVMIESFTALHHVVSLRGYVEAPSFALWFDFLDSGLVSSLGNIFIYTFMCIKFM